MAGRLLTMPMFTGSRNIHVWSNDGEYLGGLRQSDSNAHFTHMDLYDCMDIACVFPNSGPWDIWKANGNGSTRARLPRSQSLIQRGTYLILTQTGAAIEVHPNPERPIRRVPTQEKNTSRMTSEEANFRNALRSRDSGCAISGLDVDILDDEPWKGFETAHIFPVGKIQLWNQHGWRNVVNDTRGPQHIGTTKMYSPQNGLLLRADIHQLFDSFRVGINPDRGYKVFSFGADKGHLGGKVLKQSARQPADAEDRVSDRLLRWHFRQCVWTNVKEAGEPGWQEHDFGGQNEIEQIMELGDGPALMEEELFNRLGPYIQVSA